jgi:hypothetical protein
MYKPIHVKKTMISQKSKLCFFLEARWLRIEISPLLKEV